MEENQVKTIDLGNGSTANLLVPDLNENQNLSIVDTSVLIRILEYLPKESFVLIKEKTANRIMESKNLIEMSNIMEDEIRFHKSVNLIEDFIMKKEHPTFTKQCL